MKDEEVPVKDEKEASSLGAVAASQPGPSQGVPPLLRLPSSRALGSTGMSTPVWKQKPDHSDDTSSCRMDLSNFSGTPTEKKQQYWLHQLNLQKSLTV